MGIKTWALVLGAAYAASQYMKKARQHRLEAGDTGGAGGETRPSRLRQLLDADLPGSVERLRQTQPAGASGGVASSQGDGSSHEDLLSPSSQTTTPG